MGKDGGKNYLEHFWGGEEKEHIIVQQKQNKKHKWRRKNCPKPSKITK